MDSRPTDLPKPSTACGCAGGCKTAAPQAVTATPVTTERRQERAPGAPAERRSAEGRSVENRTGGEAHSQVDGKPQGEDRRKSVVDRRAGVDRRQMSREASGYTGPERRSGVERREDTGLERRRGPGRRRSDDRKAAEEGEMTGEQLEFCLAIETYKKVNKKMFPTWTEVLEVVQHLGYRKIEKRDINLDGCPEPELHNGKPGAKNAA